VDKDTRVSVFVPPAFRELALSQSRSVNNLAQLAFYEYLHHHGGAARNPSTTQPERKSEDANSKRHRKR
jgi:hypothetical protein